MLLYGFIQVSSALNPTVPTSSEVFNTSCKLRSEVQSHCLHFHCCNCLYPHYAPLSQSHDKVWEQKKLAPMSTRQKMHEMIESSVCHFILFWWSLKSKLYLHLEDACKTFCTFNSFPFISLLKLVFKYLFMLVHCENSRNTQRMSCVLSVFYSFSGLHNSWHSTVRHIL